MRSEVLTSAPLAISSFPIYHLNQLLLISDVGESELTETLPFDAA